MHVVRRRGWELPASAATPEHVFLSRRAFLGATAGSKNGSIAIAASRPGR